MGVLNVTPDSFSDGGQFFAPEDAIRQALQMVEDGADIIDIGGESTRPGAMAVDVREELRRVVPVVEAVAKRAEVLISIDTTKAAVARAALSAGAELVNDVSALRFDPEMAPLVREAGVPVVLMHMRGEPATMQEDIHYDDVVGEIRSFLGQRIRFAQSEGIERKRILIDPGIGFGKSLGRDNLCILRNLSEFRSLGRPILIGVSRKAFLGHLSNSPVDDREEETAAAVAAAVMNGASIVRIHNVRKIKRVVRVIEAIKQA